MKIPIAVLKAGETRVLKPNLEFCNDSVTFKLVQGSGPVYLSGRHVVSDVEREEWQDDGEGCEDEDDEECEMEEDGGSWPTQQQNGKSRRKE